MQQPNQRLRPPHGLYGSPFALDSPEDSEHELYRHIGATRTVSELTGLMMTVSSGARTPEAASRLIAAIAHALYDASQ